MWVWEGFWRLSNARPQGMNGPLSIPFSEIHAYGLIKRYDYERTQDFLHYVVLLDNEYMSWVRMKQQEEEQARNNKP